MLDFIDDFEKFGAGFGAEQAYAGGPEVGYSLEDGSVGQVAADVEDPAVFVNAGDALVDLPAEHAQAVSEWQRRVRRRRGPP